MSDFISVCENILNSEDDINVRGWKEAHKLLTYLLECSDIIYLEGYEASVTGSSVEGGKVYEPDDVGDLDVMVASKQDVVAKENVVAIPDHPGFVKILINGDTMVEKQYLKASTLNENIPERILSLLKMIRHYWSQKESMKIIFLHKRLGTANTIDASNNFQSLHEQLQGSDELTDAQVAFFQNVLHSQFRYQDIPNSDQISAELAKELRQEADGVTDRNLTTAFNLIGKLGLSAREKIKSSFAENNDTSSQSSNPICQPKGAVDEQTKAEVIVDEKVETENNFLEEESIPGTSHQQQSPENENNDNVNSASSSSGNSFSDAAAKFQQFGLDLFWEKFLNPFKDSTLIDPTAEETQSVEITEPKPDLPRKAGVDIVMSKKINDWPLNLSEWFERQQTSKLTPDVIPLIKDSSIYVVSKHPQNMHDPDEIEHTFRLSFSHPEKVLCSRMKSTQLKCYRLMKALHNAKFKKCSDKFSSYHIKTTLFWAIEKNDPDIWVPEKLEDCIGLLLFNLLAALEEKRLEHYFIKGMNLFDDFCAEDFQKLEDEINKILENMTSSFEDIYQQFIEKSTAVTKKTSVEVPSTVSSEPLKPFSYQEWSRKYNQTVLDLLTEVSTTNLQPRAEKKFSDDLKAPIQKALNEEKITIDGFFVIFDNVKFGLYQKRCYFTKDMKRPLCDVILESITDFVQSYVKYYFSFPKEDVMDANVMLNNLLEGCQNGDADAKLFAGYFYPDPQELVKSLFETFGY